MKKKETITKKAKVCKYCVVKRKGHIEDFDERKIYASCYAACLNAHVPHTEAESICEKVSGEMKKWAMKKKSADSTEIFKQTVSAIRKHHEDAAFMYETHRDIC